MLHNFAMISASSSILSLLACQLVLAAPFTHNTTIARRADMNGFHELIEADATACKKTGPVDGADMVWGPAIFGTQDGHGTYDRGEFHAFGGGNNE